MSYETRTRRARPHGADVLHAQQVAASVSYVVHFRRGPGEVYRETAGDLVAARAIASRLDAAHGAHGRRAIVYGVLPSGVSVPLSAADLEVK